ncbi:MAG: hypothetical protein A2481_02270 [Candidatus Yonathbacteria bacterium RIFOXYC2_FULL_47_9]|nr:MAG: hypothetical protein A2481_02270 [Candidatus Yonathbacteria bacterium RIFOXYC2_FULL_47_9]HAT68525.1 hypothetical protein [Candidatus Yonathbacteria bacterium]
MMLWRISFTVLLLSAVLYAPWWLALLLALWGAFYFSRYYEIILLGVLTDLLYGTSGGMLIGYGMEGFLLGAAIFVAMERIKRELR